VLESPHRCHNPLRAGHVREKYFLSLKAIARDHDAIGSFFGIGLFIRCFNGSSKTLQRFCEFPQLL
jgi:hypothetical protein